MARRRVRKGGQRLIRFILWMGFLGVRALWKRVPFLLRLKWGGALGKSAFLLLPKERGKALHHIRQAIGDDYSHDEQRRIARECFQNLGRTFSEVLSLENLNRNDVNRLVIFEGDEFLKETMASGRGAIFVTGHVGNWELLAVAVAMRCPLAVVAAPMYDPRFENFLIGLRTAHGVETLIRDTPGSLRRMLTILRKGGMVGILMDQDTKVDGTFVPFFHRMAYTPTGAANLALRTGAVVVVGFIQREGLMQHRVVIHQPIRLASSGHLERDVEAGTARFTKMIEDQVRQTPEQWVWMHRRWRTQKPETVS